MSDKVAIALFGLVTGIIGYFAKKVSTEDHHDDRVFDQMAEVQQLNRELIKQNGELVKQNAELQAALKLATESVDKLQVQITELEARMKGVTV